MNRAFPSTTIAVLSIVAAALAGCAAPGGGGAQTAGAQLAPTAGNAAAGSVRFEQRGMRTRVVGHVTGLAPGREHGFHVHERGDCSAPDATSAGGHFNPGGRPHGAHASAEHHAGDLPSLRADAQGVATIDWTTNELTVAEGPVSVVGRAVVVHRDPDDFKSQPAGNSGPRLACGVIRR